MRITTASFLLLLLMAAPGIADIEKCRIGDLAGLYESQWGKIQCDTNNNQLECCYGNLGICDKKLFLTLTSAADELKGRWEYSNGTTGAAKFAVDDDCNIRDGFWGSGHTATNAWYVSKRVEIPSSALELEEKAETQRKENVGVSRNIPPRERRRPTPATASTNTKATNQESNECDTGQSCRLLGDKYVEGKVVLADSRLAERYYLKACQLEDVVACRKVGLMYYHGRTTQQDYKKAHIYLHGACDEQDWYACAVIGSSYVYGKGVDKNSETAIEFLAKACDMGDAHSCVSAAIEYGKLNKQHEEIEYMERSCELGFNQNCGYAEKLAKGRGEPQKESIWAARTEELREQNQQIDQQIREIDAQLSDLEHERRSTTTTSSSDKATTQKANKKEMLLKRIEEQEAATERALEATEAKEKAANAELEDIMQGAHRLPDGRAVFYSAEGNWYFENGDIVPPELIREMEGR